MIASMLLTSSGLADGTAGVSGGIACCCLIPAAGCAFESCARARSARIKSTPNAMAISAILIFVSLWLSVIMSVLPLCPTFLDFEIRNPKLLTSFSRMQAAPSPTDARPLPHADAYWLSVGTGPHGAQQDKPSLSILIRISAGATGPTRRFPQTRSAHEGRQPCRQVEI